MSARPKAQIRPPAGAAAFIAQADNRPVPEATSPLVDQSTSRLVDQSAGARVAESPRRGAITRKRKGELDRVTGYLPYELGDQLRMHCAAHRLELSAAMTEAVREWLDRRNA